MVCKGVVCPARDKTAPQNARLNCIYGFPFWGKLSPQVTDEGVPAGHFPLIRRAGAPPSPLGRRLLHGGAVWDKQIKTLPFREEP